MDFTDLDIVVGGASSVKNDVSDGVGAGIGGTGKKRVIKDRRKNRQDRRRSVREGIFVSLSVEGERRLSRDRRKVT
jgi:hypothetical protein